MTDGSELPEPELSERPPIGERMAHALGGLMEDLHDEVRAIPAWRRLTPCLYRMGRIEGALLVGVTMYHAWADG